MNKVCKICCIEKDISDFRVYKIKDKDYYRNTCKSCERELNKKYRNQEKDKLRSKKWRNNNIERSREIDKKWCDNNKEKLKQKHKKWKEKNPDYVKEYNKKRHSLKPELYIYDAIRTQIRQSLQKCGYSKNSKTYEILGCDFDFFKTYLEGKFETWMNWENHGKYNGDLSYGWDIDHIIPISSANSEEDIIKLNHYTNLQPLCSYVNRNIKRAKYGY